MEDTPLENQAPPASVSEPQPTATPVVEPSSSAPTQISQEPQATAPVTPTPATPPVTKPVSAIPSEERIMAAIGYIPMGFVAPLIIEPKSKFCQVHAKQGMVLTIITFVVLFLLVLIPAIGSLLFLGLIAAIAIGGFQAYSGLEWKIPVISDIAMKINVDGLFATPPAKTISTTPTPTPAPDVTPTPTEATTPPATPPEVPQS